MSRPRLAGIAVAVLLAACSGGQAQPDPGESASGEVATVELGASDTLTFDRAGLVAPAGVIAIRLSCGPAVPHNLVVEGAADDEPVVACDGGETSVGTVELAAGEYTYYCSIPGHRATMEGTLTVS